MKENSLRLRWQFEDDICLPVDLEDWADPLRRQKNLKILACGTVERSLLVDSRMLSDQNPIHLLRTGSERALIVIVRVSE